MNRPFASTVDISVSVHPEPPRWKGIRSGSRWMAKRLAEKTLTLPPLLGALKRRSRGSSIILAYHNVIPDDEEATGLPGAHLSLGEFLWHLDLLAECCSVVPLDDLLEKPREEGPPRAAITFDDAYAGTLRLALPALRARGFPATVFVPTGLVGRGAFWWDDLGVSGWEGERLPLELLGGEGDRIRNWAESVNIPPRPQGPSQMAGTEDDILQAGCHPGVTFGVHTAGHPNLARMSRQEVRRELLEARAWLMERHLPLSMWLSYPYGLTSPEAQEVVKELGFQAAVTITGGCLPTKPTNPFALPRLNIPAGISRENFILRLLGVISG